VQDDDEVAEETIHNYGPGPGRGQTAARARASERR
jgi:hypothetical protein